MTMPNDHRHVRPKQRKITALALETHYLDEGRRAAIDARIFDWGTKEEATETIYLHDCDQAMRDVYALTRPAYELLRDKVSDILFARRWLALNPGDANDASLVARAMLPKENRDEPGT